jgi:hypothetical protein
MAMIPHVQVIGDKETLAAIGRASGPRLRRAVVLTARASMRPTLTAAQALAPRESGRLRGSLKISVLSSHYARRHGEVGVAIAPANDFTFRGITGTKYAVTRNRARERRLHARGYVTGLGSVWNYAHIIETGLTRKGKRRARASWYLRRALAANAQRMIREMGDGIMVHLDETKA